MIVSDERIGVTAEIIDAPTWGQLDDFEEALKQAFDKRPQLTTAQLTAINFEIAAQLGLITSWQCSRRPGVPLSTPRELDAEAVLLVGRAVAAHLKGIKALSKNS